jgi:hypothetical protein
LITATAIIAHVANVTSEEIGRCHKVLAGGKSFYMVESEKDCTVEYKVQYSREHGFTCTCPSGEYGFANVKHPAKVCKHVRWSVAAAQEERAALREQTVMQAQALIAEQPQLIINGQPADSETFARVMNAQPAKASKAQAQSPKAFSLLR